MQNFPSVLCYTLLELKSGPTIVFLLWRDSRGTANESSSYWSSIVCPKVSDDKDDEDAIVRVLSKKTRGLFAAVPTQSNKLKKGDTKAARSFKAESAAQTKSDAKLEAGSEELLKQARATVRAKLDRRKGVRVLGQEHVMHVLPVRFVAAGVLNGTCSRFGQAAWVTADALFHAVTSPGLSKVAHFTPADVFPANPDHPDPDPTISTDADISLPLYLPFLVSLRRPFALDCLAGLLEEFKVPVPSCFMPTPEPSDPTSISTQTATPTPGTAVGTLLADFNMAAASSQLAPAVNVSKNVVAEKSLGYRCSKCRRFLFPDTAVVEHASDGDPYTTTNPEGAGFASKRFGARGSPCSSLFLSPDGAREAFGDLELNAGNLGCPKCHIRVGSFAWSGAQCSCGQWLVPALQVYHFYFVVSQRAHFL
jgi:dual specificity phosphatase 12